MRTLVAIDTDHWACETYRANFPGVRVIKAPVRDFLDQLPQADVIIGGPPCQPFSAAGQRKGADDERNGWPEFVAAIAIVKPRMFLAENVVGMLDRKQVHYFASVVRDLEQLGYDVQIRELDAVNFGAPQFRNRVWVWGIRSNLGLRHKWPEPTHAWPPPTECMFGGNLLPAITVREALGLDGALFRQRGTNWGERPDFEADEPSMTINGGKGHDGCRLMLQSHGGNKGGELSHDSPSPTMRNCVPGCSDILVHQYRWSDKMLAKHPPASPAPSVQAKWFKGGAEGLLAVDAPDESCATITAGSHIGGPEPVPHRKRQGFVRRLTPLECAKLQTLPDDFKWPEGITKTAMYRVIGNGWASVMGTVFSQAFAAVDPKSETMIDLFCGGGCGAAGWHSIRSLQNKSALKALGNSIIPQCAYVIATAISAAENETTA